MHFLTGVCAIIGGIFTGKKLRSFVSIHDPVIRMFHCLFIVLKIPLLSVPLIVFSLPVFSNLKPVLFCTLVAGLVDSFIYHSSKVLKEKIELGKAG